MMFLIMKEKDYGVKDNKVLIYEDLWYLVK